eukprot:EG_transcript_30989
MSVLFGRIPIALGPRPPALVDAGGASPKQPLGPEYLSDTGRTRTSTGWWCSATTPRPPPGPSTWAQAPATDLFGRWETERMAALLPAATHVFDREEINVLGLRIFGVSYHQSLNGTELPKGLDLLVSHEPPL